MTIVSTTNFMTILVTGGAGFIGSHTLLALIKAGHTPIVIDNFANSTPTALERVSSLAGVESLQVYRADLCDDVALESVFQKNKVDAVIHFAGLKAVGESVAKPLDYYQTNIGSTLVLLDAMQRHNCFNIVFSSSATVYGSPEKLPITEDQPLSATNPYGRTKLFIEEILRDLADSDPRWHIALLRYFNPVGAHPSGRLGESPSDAPNNLFPCITQFMVGRRPALKVFGDDYPTSDGSGVRDYLHVSDLAEGHVAAINEIEQLAGAVPINLGNGHGSSVLEVIRMFEEVAGQRISYEVVPRRSGDVAECYADPSKAEKLLHWKAHKSLRLMCEDSWRWQTMNPQGYEA